MAAIRTLKAKETYKEWIMSLLKFVTLLNDPNHCQSKSLMIPIRPTASRVGQGTKEENLLEDSHQKLGSKMVKGKDWQSLFNSIENKNDLINITGSFLHHETGRQKVTGNVVFTQNEKALKISKNDAVEVFECNHEEAGMRMVLHACLDDTNIVVVSRGTDVFILLVHAFSIVKPTS